MEDRESFFDRRAILIAYANKKISHKGIFAEVEVESMGSDEGFLGVAETCVSLQEIDDGLPMGCGQYIL